MTQRVETFIGQLQKHTPSLTIKYKDESLLMRVCGTLSFFNPSFMTHYTTTLGSTIYFPNRIWYETQSEENLLQIIAHEYVHVRDSENFSILYPLMYIFPISLAPLMALLFFVLPWPICLILILTCFAPLPAPGRMYFERRGYVMNMFVLYQFAKESGTSESRIQNALKEMARYFSTQFTGFQYYLMWPFGIEDKLLEAGNSINSEEIVQTEDIYIEVADALVASKPQ